MLMIGPGSTPDAIEGKNNMFRAKLQRPQRLRRAAST
jgi:hypothetical protein